MSGEIEENHIWKRPAFNYPDANVSYDVCISKLTESNRNINSDILGEIREMNRLLRRLDRRFSHLYPVNGRRRK